jgi:hypothetical protein
MNLDTFQAKMAKYNDAVIYTNKGFLVGTLDFDNRYIRTMMRTASTRDSSDSVTVFSWDKNKFITLKTSDILRVTPLTSELKRVR